MKLKQVDQLNYVVKRLLDNQDIKLSSKLKFRLLTILKQLEPTVTNLSTIRDEKIREYGEPDENGELVIKRGTEEYTKFEKEFGELLNTESDIEVKKFKASELFEANIPSDYLIALYDYIEEDE